MPLPFLKPKRQESGLIMAVRTPDGSIEKTGQEGEDHALEACAEDALRAIHSKDIKAYAAAIRAAFEILDSEPHEEGPHTNESEEQEAE